MAKKILLIKGGISSERDVSLSTGEAFESALKELGAEYIVLDAQANLPSEIEKHRSNVDVALLALHGKWAEDGTVQGICEYLKLPYTGAGVLGSALCFNKLYTKQILTHHNIPMADYRLINESVDNLKEQKAPYTFPCVVKPIREGSSVGVSIVQSEEEYIPALELAAKYDTKILVEEYLEGPELAVPMLVDRALTPIEIRPKSGFYDYKNKYTSGQTDYILPPELPEATIAKLKELAVKAHSLCEIRTYSRVDFRMHKGGPVLVEINTLPGCTKTSLVPMAAAREGISFPQFIQTLIDNAGLDYDKAR